MRTLLLAITLLFAVNAAAQSPDQPLPKAKISNQPVEPDKRGTEQSPIVIKVIPPLVDDEKSATEKKEREEKYQSDWWLVCLTGVLAGIGILQLCVFGLQARRLRQTVEEMKIATKAAEKAANAAEQSAEIARHDFVATHRPKIIVRRFSINKIGDDGDSVDIGYEMVNVGEGLATVVRSSTKLWWHTPTKHLPGNPPYADYIAQSIPIESGIMIALPSQHVEGFSFVSGFEEKEQETGANDTTTGDHLFAMGYIEYKDTIGKTRRTAFLRKYNFTSKCFDTIPHPDYEYVD